MIIKIIIFIIILFFYFNKCNCYFYDAVLATHNGTYYRSSESHEWKKLEFDNTSPINKWLKKKEKNSFTEIEESLKKEKIYLQERISFYEKELKPRVINHGYGYIELFFDTHMNRTIRLVVPDEIVEFSTTLTYIKLDVHYMCIIFNNVNLIVSVDMYAYSEIIACPEFITSDYSDSLYDKKIEKKNQLQTKFISEDSSESGSSSILDDTSTSTSLESSSVQNREIIYLLKKQLKILEEDRKLLEKEYELLRIIKTFTIEVYVLLFFGSFGIYFGYYGIVRLLKKNNRSLKNVEKAIQLQTTYQNQSRNYVSPRKNLTSAPRPTLFLIFLFLFICTTDAVNSNVFDQECSRIMPVGKGVHKTTYKKGNGTVTDYTDGFFSFIVPDNSYFVCLDLTDEFGRIIETLVLDFSHYFYTTIENYEYISGDREGVISSTSACAHKEGCNEGRCGGIKFNDYTCQGALKEGQSIASKYPGKSFCTSPFKGNKLNCGPVAELQDMCQYSRVAIRPKGLGYDFYKIKDVILEKKVTIKGNKTHISNGINNVTAPLSATYHFGVDAIDRSLVGYNFVRIGNDVYVGHAADRDNPIAGLPGEIQASSEQDWYKVDNGLKLAIPATGLWDNVNYYEADGSVYTRVDFYKSAFPKVYSWLNNSFQMNNCYWTYSPGNKSFSCKPPIHGLIEVTLTFNKNYSISSTENSVCVVGRQRGVLEKLKSSSQGSAFFVELKSSCFPGDIVVSCKDNDIQLSTPALTITQEFKNYTIRFRTSKSHINTIFYFNDYEVQIEAELEYEKFDLDTYGVDQQQSKSNKADDEDEKKKKNHSGSSGKSIFDAFAQIKKFFIGLGKKLGDLGGLFSKYKKVLFIVMAVVASVLLLLALAYVKNMLHWFGYLNVFKHIRKIKFKKNKKM